MLITNLAPQDYEKKRREEEKLKNLDETESHRVAVAKFMQRVSTGGVQGSQGGHTGRVQESHGGHTGWVQGSLGGHTGWVQGSQGGHTGWVQESHGVGMEVTQR